MIPTMQLPLRILRAAIDDLPGRQPQLSPLEADRRDRMVEAAGALLCQHGRESLTLRMIAACLRFTPATVERHFPDFPSLIGEVFTRHLQSIFTAMQKIPADAADRQAARRVIYLNATRSAFGTYTRMHQLYVRERGALPDDIGQPLDQLRLAIGALVSREHGEAVLDLLDILALDPAKIEAFIGLLESDASAIPEAAPAYSEEPVLTDALIASMFRPDPSLQEQGSKGTRARAGPADQAGPDQAGNGRKRLLELVSRQPV